MKVGTLTCTRKSLFDKRPENSHAKSWSAAFFIIKAVIIPVISQETDGIPELDKYGSDRSGQKQNKHLFSEINFIRAY